MVVDGDRVLEMLVKETNGVSVTPTNREEETFLKKLRKEIAEIEAKGQVVEVPSEIPG